MLNSIDVNSEKETLGQYLRREREFRGITLEEISSVTRIPFRHLVNLEADALEALPGQTFIKGYIRAYSNHIGLDGEQVVLRYEELLAEQEGENEENKNGYLAGIKKLFGRSSSRANGIILQRN